MHDEIIFFLLSLAVLLCAARLLGEVARKLGFPSVVGEILGGVLVGKTVLGRVSPEVFGWVFREGVPRTLLTGYTTVAVILLLVVAGLEVDLTIVRRSGRTALLTSALGAVIPFVLGVGTGMLLPDSALADPSKRLLHASFLGIALSISALPVIAKTLLDLSLLKTDFGLIVLSAAVVDDLAGWIGFSVLSHQFTKSDESSIGSIVLSIALTVAFVVVALLIVRPCIDWLLGRMQTPQDAASGRVLSIIMVLALVGAATTQKLGMHAVFGGFVMGVAVGDSSRLREHTRTVLNEFVISIFTPVFFATIALRVDFVASFDLSLTLIVVAIACLAKIVGCAAGARLGGFSWREATAIGFGMNSRGAMEILLALLALEAGIIRPQLFVALVIMAIFTSLISGPAMSRLLRPAPSPIVSLLRAGVIRLDLAPAPPESIIRTVATALAERLGRPADATSFAAAVLQREHFAGSGLGDGVAVPHAEVKGLVTPALALARIAHGVDFDAPDGKEVRLVFLLLYEEGEYQRELEILRSIAQLLGQESVRTALLEAKTQEAVMGVLVGAERAISAKNGPNGTLTPIPPGMRPRDQGSAATPLPVSPRGTGETPLPGSKGAEETPLPGKAGTKERP